MELRHLRYFVVVAREGHYGRAARKLNVTQPAISRAIHALEEELGVKLFNRLSRGVRLAEVGQRYLADVERILADLDVATRAAQGVAKESRQELRIGHTLMETLDKEFEKILERFSLSHPQVHLKLQYMSSFDQQVALRDHVIDLGFSHLVAEPMHGLKKKRVADSPICAARIGASHRLAKMGQVSLPDLSHEPLVIYPRERNPQMFDYVVHELRAAGFAGEIVQNAESVYWSWKVMPKNSGWILDNRCGMLKSIENTVSIPIPGLSIPFGIDLVWSESNRSRSVELFLETMGAG